MAYRNISYGRMSTLIIVKVNIGFTQFKEFFSIFGLEAGGKISSFLSCSQQINILLFCYPNFLEHYTPFWHQKRYNWVEYNNFDVHLDKIPKLVSLNTSWVKTTT